MGGRGTLLPIVSPTLCQRFPRLKTGWFYDEWQILLSQLSSHSLLQVAGRLAALHGMSGRDWDEEVPTHALPSVETCWVWFGCLGSLGAGFSGDLLALQVGPQGGCHNVHNHKLWCDSEGKARLLSPRRRPEQDLGP